MSKSPCSVDVRLPPFLYGTFDWRVNGLHFDSVPPLDLLAPTALDAANPWIVLSSVIEHAKTGDHTQVRRLRRFFHAVEPFALNLISLLLVGDIASDTDLVLLQETMESDDRDARVHAAKAARFAGRLWLVPTMLEAWHRAETMDHRESIGFAISDLLESGTGSIANEASHYNLPARPLSTVRNPRLREFLEKRATRKAEPERFPGLVNDAYARLTDRFGTDRITVWCGDLFDVTILAQEFLTKVQGSTLAPLFTYRHKFEANTGIDCRRFFVDLWPQRLEIQVVLEDFLTFDAATKYKPGVRYFFGHPIPD